MTALALLSLVKLLLNSKFLCSYSTIMFSFVFLIAFRLFVVKPVNGRVERTSAAETVDSGLIPDRVKPKAIKIGIHNPQLPCLKFSDKKQCEASTICGRQVGRWQLDLKTERSLPCLLTKVAW